jgi:hypothetical protein
MAAKLIKGLAISFGLATTLGGCATMNYTGTDDCVERSGYSMNMVLLNVSKRNDRFSEECATAKAATAISGMKRRDGTPDMGMYNLAISMYEQSNERVRAFMDEMLKKDQGTTIAQMKFELEKTREPVRCERVETKGADGVMATAFKCTGKTAAAATAAPAAK